MNTSKNIKDEVLLRAEKVLYYNDLLITQCNSWLSAEEGNENMIKQITEKENVKRKIKIRKIFGVTSIKKIVKLLKK